MHFTITAAQMRSMDTLKELGMVITNFYPDGIVRMALPSTDAPVAAFIRPNGTVKRQVVPTFDADGIVSTLGSVIDTHA